MVFLLLKADVDALQASTSNVSKLSENRFKKPDSLKISIDQGRFSQKFVQDGILEIMIDA